jgi:hypothetical protein
MKKQHSVDKYLVNSAYENHYIPSVYTWKLIQFKHEPYYKFNKIQCRLYLKFGKTKENVM